jgi:hypothetical protein
MVRFKKGDTLLCIKNAKDSYYKMNDWSVLEGGIVKVTRAYNKTFWGSSRIRQNLRSKYPEFMGLPNKSFRKIGKLEMAMHLL